MELRFADCSLDCDRYAFMRAGEQVDMQPKVWAFLKLLGENPQRVLPKDEIIDSLWPDVAVAEGSLQRLASLAREAIGQDDLLRTVRGVGYQLVADVEIIGDAQARPESPATTPPTSESIRSQEFRFCRTVDGVNVAWTSIGEGPAVVRALGWFTNLEYELAWPRARKFWEIFGEGRRLILYDGRGMGLSDPSEEFTPEIRLRDLEAVVDAAEVDRFDLVGMSEGCGTAVSYSLRHPARVQRLVLYGPPGFVFRDLEPEDRELGRVMLSLIEATWGSSAGRFGRMLAELFVGQSADTDTLNLFDRMQRASTDKETAIRYFRAMASETRPDASALRVPTLIVHRKEDAIAPFAAAKVAATQIAGSRLVPIAGDNHWPLADDPTAPLLLRAISEFLDGD